MSVLCLADRGQSTQAISLSSLVGDKCLVAAVNEAMTIPRMAEVIALGEFSSIEGRFEALDGRLKAHGKNTMRLGNMLRAYSQLLLGTHASMVALRPAMANAALDRTTLSYYHAVLEEGGIIKDLPPCTPVLTSPTLCIHDLGRLAQRFAPIATRSGLTCDCVITDQGDTWLWWHRHWVGA